MSVLTLKIPPFLVRRLADAASTRARSRSALVREAIEAYLADDRTPAILDRIAKATRRILEGKPSRPEPDWTDIYAETRVDTGMTPEEEVRHSRTRGL